MSRHRADVRPRYGRLAVLGSSLTITTIAVLGGTGALPSVASDGSRPAAASVADRTPSHGAEPSAGATPGADDRVSARHTEAENDPSRETTLPAGSGSGRRVVFSQSRQRVWLVGGAEHVARTYLVSGSVSDNLHPGTYSVYSRSEQAWGIDDSGTMRWFVRFTQGDTGAAIGFHDIPVDNGKQLQTKAQLGTPQSHGCIRQKESDAKALWAFAPLGTKVVVVA